MTRYLGLPVFFQAHHVRWGQGSEPAPIHIELSYCTRSGAGTNIPDYLSLDKSLLDWLDIIDNFQSLKVEAFCLLTIPMMFEHMLIEKQKQEEDNFLIRNYFTGHLAAVCIGRNCQANLESRKCRLNW